eukprot:8614198-Prorocentrum_lima.AAC.1
MDNGTPCEWLQVFIKDAPFSIGICSVIIGALADLAARRFPAAIITAYADDIIVVCDADQAEAIY